MGIEHGPGSSGLLTRPQGLLLAQLLRPGASPALRKALTPSGRLDDVAFLQGVLLTTLEEKRTLERRCLEAELALAAAAAAKPAPKKR